MHKRFANTDSCHWHSQYSNAITLSFLLPCHFQVVDTSPTWLHWIGWNLKLWGLRSIGLGGEEAGGGGWCTGSCDSTEADPLLLAYTTTHWVLSTEHWALSTTHWAIILTHWWWTLLYPLPTEHYTLPYTAVVPTTFYCHPGPLLCTFHWMHLLAFARDTDAPFKQAFAADLLRRDRKSTQHCRCNFFNRVVALLPHIARSMRYP